MECFERRSRSGVATGSGTGPRREGRSRRAEQPTQAGSRTEPGAPYSVSAAPTWSASE